MCIRPGGEEVLSPGRRVMDVCVSIAHCKKVVFTFYLFTFLNIIQLYSFTISSTGPFSISEGEGHFFIDSFFRWILISMSREKRRFVVC